MYYIILYDKSFRLYTIVGSQFDLHVKEINNASTHIYSNTGVHFIKKKQCYINTRAHTIDWTYSVQHLFAYRCWIQFNFSSWMIESFLCNGAILTFGMSFMFDIFEQKKNIQVYWHKQQSLKLDTLFAKVLLSKSFDYLMFTCYYYYYVCTDSYPDLHAYIQTIRTSYSLRRITDGLTDCWKMDR